MKQKMIDLEPGNAAHTYNASTWEAEAGRLS